MKGSLLLAIIAFLHGNCIAQNLENIKFQLMLQQHEKAKTEIDKALTNQKVAASPETYILKASIYGALAMESRYKGTEEQRRLTAEGDAAFKKYKSMDPAMPLLSEPTYQNGAVSLYSIFYLAGYNDYSSKNWALAYPSIIKAIEYSDLLIEKKILKSPLDTNVVILAGIISENSNHKDDAAKYYRRLADNKVAGPDYESIYRYLVADCYNRKDMICFEKYKALGAQLYPQSAYFTFDRVDFAVGLTTNFNEKIKAVEELLAKEPNNSKANQVLGEIIFDTLNPRDDNTPPLPNAAELEKKMVAAFNKAAASRPGYEIPYLYIGDHFINKAVKVDNKRTVFNKEMKERTQPGTPNSQADIKQRDALDKEYGVALGLAEVPYEKAAAIFATKPALTTQDKQQYKKAVSYLADINSYNKILNKDKPDISKEYAEKEKKWISLWESIK